MTDIEKSLHRVTWVSALNDWSVVIFAIICAGATVAFGGRWWALLCVGILISGLMELVGRDKVKMRRSDGGRWLLGLIILYCVYQLASFDANSIMKSVSSVIDAQALRDIGMDEATPKHLIHRTYYMLYISVIAATLLYQGGLCLYYWRKTRKLGA